MLKGKKAIYGVITSLLVLNILLLLIPTATSAADTAQCYSDLDLTERKQEIMESVRYFTYEENNFVYFNIEKAKNENAEEEVLAIGENINAITEELEQKFDNGGRISLRVSMPMLYGNYCGKGNNGWDKKPKDDLDTACRNHDKCYVHGGNNTNCNRTFCNSLRAITRKEPEGTTKFRFMAAAMTIFCRGV